MMSNKHAPSDDLGWLNARIDAEMAEYSDGAYADHGSARDQLARLVADVMAPLYIRILELTRHAAEERVPICDEALWEMWVDSPSDVLEYARRIERWHGVGGNEAAPTHRL